MGSATARQATRHYTCMTRSSISTDFSSSVHWTFLQNISWSLTHFFCFLMINCTILIKNICCELHSYFIVNILPPLFFFFIITINLKSDFEITLHTKECGHKMNYWRWKKRIKNQWDVIRRFFSISIPKKTKKFFPFFCSITSSPGWHLTLSYEQGNAHLPVESVASVFFQSIESWWTWEYHESLYRPFSHCFFTV